MNGRLWMFRCYNEANCPRQGNDNVVLERQTDSQSETGRISLQRLRGRGKEEEKSLQSEEGQRVGAALRLTRHFILSEAKDLACRQVDSSQRSE
jgi:hypothetical protein